MSCEASSVLDCKLPLRPCCFQLTPADFTSRPSPVLLRVRVHPLMCLPPLQSPSSFQTRPECRSTQDNLPRVSVLIATSAERIYLPASFPPLAYVPSAAFLALSTAYSSLRLAGLFHPAATSRIHLPGAFPATQPAASSTTCALLSLVPLVCPTVANWAPTCGTPPSGLCSKQRSVANHRGFSPIHCPFPS